MNKKVYALAVVVFNVLSLQSFSQLAIPNGDFEKFTVAGSQYTFEGWSSFMFFSPQFTGTADAHTGKMALKVYNDKNTGGQITCQIINKDNNYPVKVKGFIKHFVAPGEKVKISISNTYTTVGSNNQTMRYVEPIGSTYFTGTSDGYQPFEITLGYKLANSLFYDNANIGKFEIEILSYDDYKPFGSKISDQTYISVDDLTFEGQISSLPRFTTGVPDGLENWVSLNNKLYPEEWTDGLYANQKSYRYFSQSTDAAEGKYSLKISLDTTKENYNNSGIKRILIDNAKKKLSLKMKYNLGLGDSLTLLLTGNRFSPFVKAIQITGVQSVNFKEELVSLTDFADNSICYIGFIFKKASSNAFKTFVLIDDIKLVAEGSVGVEESADNSSLQVHPNPSESGMYEIMINVDERLEVFDINGKPIEFSTMTSSGTTTLNISTNLRGVYFLKAGNHKIQKLIY